MKRILARLGIVLCTVLLGLALTGAGCRSSSTITVESDVKPAPRKEVRPRKPGPTYVWVPGHWKRMDKRTWRWVPGHWRKR